VEVGELEILPHDKPLITVTAETRYINVTVRREENVVYVHAEVDEAARGMKQFFNKGPKANLLIHVPADCEINAKTITGTMAIRDISAPITTHMTTGKTQLANLGGPIYAKAITGMMTYEGLLIDDNHRFETVTGNLQLQLTKEPNAQVDMETTTGRMRCDFPLSGQKEQRHLTGGKLRGTLGAGTGHLKARVVTGNLHVRQAA
jgi:hypothetical protein